MVHEEPGLVSCLNGSFFERFFFFYIVPFFILQFSDDPGNHSEWL